MKHFIPLIVLFTAVGLSACAGVPKVITPEMISAVNTAETGAVAMAATTDFKCGRLDMTLVPDGQSTDKTYQLKFENSKKTHQGMATLPPGKYLIQSSLCHNLKPTGSQSVLPDGRVITYKSPKPENKQHLQRYLTPFDIKAGQVTYLGTLHMTESDIRISDDKKKGFWDHVLFSDPNIIREGRYSVSENRSDMQTWLKKFNPALAENLETQLISINDIESVGRIASRRNDNIQAAIKTTRQPKAEWDAINTPANKEMLTSDPALKAAYYGTLAKYLNAIQDFKAQYRNLYNYDNTDDAFIDDLKSNLE